MAPDRYVTLAELQEELVYKARAFHLTETEFDELLTRLLDEESERMESGEFADRTWGRADSPDDDPVPGPVKDGVIRLVRSRLDRAQADGIDSESLSSGQSASFRPPGDVMQEIKRSIDEYRPTGDTESSHGAWTV